VPKVYRILTLGLWLSIIANALAQDADKLAYFESEVRPLLLEHCIACHDRAGEISGGLILSDAAGLAKGGDSGPAIIAGDPQSSKLIDAISYQNPHLQMPPEYKLQESQIEVLRKWIADGAIDPREMPIDAAEASKSNALPVDRAQEHWAYRPVKLPPVPTFDDDVASNPIDAFLNDAAIKQGLSIAPKANDQAIRRRLAIDLTGLPPSTDQREIAIVDLIDQQLNSVHFGERFARHWMDVVRYADSITLRGFILNDAWRYRNYLIDSFNADKPINEFIREQIAGDIIATTDPNASIEVKQAQMIATSFLLLGNTNLEEQDKAQLEMDIIDEQLDVIGKGLLGQTLTCARCHDHKFDPIPTSDYYALAGILKSVISVEHENVSMFIRKPLPLNESEQSMFDDLQAKQSSMKQREKELNEQIAKRDNLQNIDPKSLPGIVVDDRDATKVGSWKDSTFGKPFVGSGYVHDQDQAKGSTSITFSPQGLEPGEYDVRIAYQFGDNRSPAVQVIVASALGESYHTIDQTKPAPVQSVWHDLGRYKFEKDGQAYVLISNAGTTGHVIADAVHFIPSFQAPPGTDQTQQAPPANAAQSSFQAPPGTDPAIEAPPLPQTATQATQPVDRSMDVELSTLKKELATVESTLASRPRTLGVKPMQVADLKVHVRGSVHSQGAVAPRGFPQFCDYRPSLDEHSDGRLELANWIVDDRNPLTARVYVNRIWMHLMGSGIVESVDNFGTTGTLPKHAELLDYLAYQFMQHGWSAKWLVRKIVTSAAYQRSCQIETNVDTEVLPQMFEAYAIGKRRPIDAEALRDTILTASGMLDLRRDQGELVSRLTSDFNYRHESNLRSVYLPTLRNSKHPMLSLFDVADPSTVVGMRNESIVSPQSLLMMNSDWIRQQSGLIAARTLAGNANAIEAANEAAAILLGRQLSDSERSAITDYTRTILADDLQSALEDVIHSLICSIDFRFMD
jgi:mono/diheme cytochrome c family protein